jgi:hypothetical protein
MSIICAILLMLHLLQVFALFLGKVTPEQVTRKFGTKAFSRQQRRRVRL